MTFLQYTLKTFTLLTQVAIVIGSAAFVVFGLVVAGAATGAL